MGDVSQALNWYIGEVIKLPQSDISSAVRSREWFIDQVKQEIKERTGEPALYPERNTLNFGSYFKGTKVRAVDEFDVLVILDTNNGVYSQNGISVGKGLGRSDPNHMFDENYKKITARQADKALNWLKDVVESATGKCGVEVLRNGQAVTAAIKSKNLKLDLVPAPVLQHNSSGEAFYAIRGRPGKRMDAAAAAQNIERLVP